MDTDTGEITESVTLANLMSSGRDGVISGFQLYPLLSKLTEDIRRDHGWTGYVHKQGEAARDNRIHGVIYYSRLTYRFPKERTAKGRKRPPAKKWRILNLELFLPFTSELDEIQKATNSLIQIAERRGIKLPYSPGSFGGSLLRASPLWNRKRRPAPRFVSEAARPNLPGNYYALRHGYKKAPSAIYLDQKSSHHTIASTIRLPHPHHLRARGRFRAVEAGRSPVWRIGIDSIIRQGHVGVVIATVNIGVIHRNQSHLYPKWADKPGERQIWLWTPELRLLQDSRFSRIKVRHISAALTSYESDPVLTEYAKWAIDQLADTESNAIKPALLAAYGMLAVRPRKGITTYTIHGRAKPIRSVRVNLPLVPGPVYRSTVERKWTPSIQNVVARGVIEAETMVRSVEMARNLESEGIPVFQVYADGLIVGTDQLPLLPENWRWVGNLVNVWSRSSNSIISDNLVRLPGIPNERRTAHIRHLTSSTRRDIVADVS